MAASRILRALATLTLALGAVTVTPAAASAAASAPETASASAAASVLADVDDFSYASWDAQYDLSLDAEGRAVMHVTETLVARFPDADQNRGIVRGIATSYEGARLDTTVLSVTDETGADVSFETETDDGVLYVLTGDDDYVQGLTTYVIEYAMRDVVLAAETGVDEFYWDLLPLDSTQDIESFRVDVMVDDSLAAGLTGAVACYEGFSGSTDGCTVHGPIDTADGTRFHLESGERTAGDGVTLAIAFEAGTVAQPAARLPNPLTDVAPMLAALGAGVLSMGSWFLVFADKKRRRTATGVVVAQYDVPASMPPLLAAAIIPRAKSEIPSEIVHLAVQGAIRIEEGAQPERPRLRLLDDTRVGDQLDAEAIDNLFLGTEGGVVDIPAASETFAARMGVLTQLGVKHAAARGFTVRARSRAAVIMQWTAIVIAAVGLAVAIWGVASGRVGAIPALVIVAFGAFLVLVSSLFSFSKHIVLTPEGTQQYEYLQGVREFIRVAEADRLQMLQSYSGAERRQDGSANVIVLYERLLPYAMLFGLEDEWGEVLEYVYSHEQRGPAWIGDAHSPALRTSLAAFAVSTASASSYSAPSTGTSSGFGGSSGGGFSGGGGGGGFSGGR